MTAKEFIENRGICFNDYVEIEYRWETIAEMMEQYAAEKCKQLQCCGNCKKSDSWTVLGYINSEQMIFNTDCGLKRPNEKCDKWEALK